MPATWIFVAFMFALFLKQGKWKNRMKWVSISLLFIFSNSFIFLETCRIWEVPGQKISQTKHYEVGIVLTGMAEYNNDLESLSIRRTADRIWQALNLYHEKKISKILISGDHGYVSDRGLHEAKQFKDILIKWGIPKNDIIIESKSKNTYENAVNTKKILERSYPHITKKLLITSGIHMKRAAACFKKINFECDQFSTDLRTGPKRQYYWDQYFVPNIGTLVDWNYIMKEAFGYLIYDIMGYI